MSFLRLDRIAKSFGDLTVLRQVTLEVHEREILALLGPSGSGKTTLLRLLAGFEEPDGGRILLDGRDISTLPPARRRFGMVFQHYALFPHLDVGENVAFGLARSGSGPGDVRRRVAETLALVDLAGFERRRVGQLSGGQQQRVALARALAPHPVLLLLDEPLSNLDPALRERTRRQLRETIRRVGITTLLVTHEQEEAFHLGARVALLHRGALEQVGTPEELYGSPATRFAATFVGRASVLPAWWRGDGAVALAAGDAQSERQVWAAVTSQAPAPGEAMELVVRPEALRLVEPGSPGALPGVVRERRYAGGAAFYSVELAAGVEIEVLAGPGAASEGAAVAVAPRPEGPPPRAFRRGEESRANGGPAAAGDATHETAPMPPARGGRKGGA